MRYILWGCIILTGIYILHLIASWAERRGWIYYRQKSGSNGGLGNALLSLQAMIEPSKRYVLEQRIEEKTEQKESCDPPDSGA